MVDLYSQWSLRQRVDLIYANALLANVLNIFIAGLFALSINQHVPGSANWLWFALLSIVASLRILLTMFYKSRKKQWSVDHWTSLYVLLSTLIGICWGISAVFYLLLDDLMARLVLFMLLIGIVASAMMILSPLPGALAGHVIPIFTGIFTVLLIEGGAWAIYIICGMLIYSLFVVMSAVNTSRQFNKQLELLFTNKNLIGNLNNEIQHRQAVQKKLESHQKALEQVVEQRTSELRDKNYKLSREIKRRQQVEEDLKHLAHHDALTNLPNRLLFNDRLKHALVRAHRHQTGGAILFIDMNGFKQVNDTFGHDTGDRLLQMVAERLSLSLREEDTISRFGGDEFVVVSELENYQNNAGLLAQKIIEILKTPFEIEGQQLHAGCSIGISLYPQDSDDPETLIKQADEAMYLAKKDGKNSFRFYSEL